LRFEESWFSLLPKIRREKFDHFIHLHASGRAKFFGSLTGARRKHYHFQNSETEKAYGKHPHALEWDGFFFRTIFGERIRLPAPVPRIYLTEREKEEGRRFWGNVDAAKVVFLGLGASRPTKRWLPEHFARLAELLKDRRELVPAIVVGPGEEEQKFAGQVIDQLRARGLRPIAGFNGDFIHHAGLSVRYLFKDLSSEKAYAANDSGPKHIAAALGIPTVTVFGPEDPVEWHPYDLSLHPIFFLPALSCRLEDNGRWCGIPVCDENAPEKHRCMRDIDPLDVFGKVP
jgi:ADP-heptose:LPS heptosyltransferase